MSEIKSNTLLDEKAESSLGWEIDEEKEIFTAEIQDMETGSTLRFSCSFKLAAGFLFRGLCMVNGTINDKFKEAVRNYKPAL